MIFVEAIPQAFGYLVPDTALVTSLNSMAPGYGHFLAQSIIVLQLFFGSYLVFLMDEVVSKYGIGSGISLFIAAGVSQQLVTGTLNWLPATLTSPASLSNPPAGALPKMFYILVNSNSGYLISNSCRGYLPLAPLTLSCDMGSSILLLWK